VDTVSNDSDSVVEGGCVTFASAVDSCSNKVLEVFIDVDHSSDRPMVGYGEHHSRQIAGSNHARTRGDLNDGHGAVELAFGAGSCVGVGPA